jgi:hypothetical protein
MWSRIAYKCAAGCRSLFLPGGAFPCGALLAAAILIQPLRAQQLGEPADSRLPGNALSTAPVAAPSDASLSTGSDGLPCAPCEQTTPGCRRHFFADALYWTVREGAAENWAQIITPHDGLWTNIGTATVIDAPFDWKAGLRVGVGAQRADGLDMALSYTNFHTSAASQASGEVYSAFMGNFYIDNPDGSDYGPHYHHASIDWGFDFHTIDFEIGRKFAIGTNLELRPFLGLKAAIINQTIKSNWQYPIDVVGGKHPHFYDFTSATEDMTLKFWGIGPSLGTTIAMPLCHRDRYSLKLFGTPSGAIMFGHWTFSEQYNNDAHSSVTIDMDPITGAATLLRGVIGFEWEQYFARATSTVRLGYEAQFWLSQMQFYSYNIGRLNNVTSLQGGFFEWRINF